MKKLSPAERYFENLLAIVETARRHAVVALERYMSARIATTSSGILEIQRSFMTPVSLSGSGGRRKGSSYKFSTPPGGGKLRKGALFGAVVTLVALVVIIVGAIRYFGAVPPPSAVMTNLSVSFPGKPTFRLPSGDEDTVSIKNLGIVESVGGDSRIPIASVTKMMSAYIVLKDHPLVVGQSGPSITVTAQDVQAYHSELSQNDSVVAVTQGEKLTELQALEAALIPSGDNIIQMLAAWDAGSVKAFVVKMNAEAKALGLKNTHYVGPSGVNPATVSTAYDQTKLADVLMQNTVFAQIVAMPQVSLPVAGLVYNVNGDLGKNGIVGVKTGWVPAGGASFVFATNLHLPSSLASQTAPMQAISTIMGQQGATPIPTVLNDALKISTQLSSLIIKSQVLPAGKEVGVLEAPYDNTIQLVTTKPVTMIGFPGAKCQVQLLVAKSSIKAPLAKGVQVGEVVLRLGSEVREVPVVTAGALSGPSFGYRVLR
ncbi:MAG: hypothetical protein M1374_07280 [Firmicutes bacterium]|nr:hypothetical protein [Bacillota bacterium]